jgi:SNF2 family DNA or RNA helicase
MPLWEHQKKGVEFVENNPACLLYWSMGAGKSYTAIESIKKTGAKKTLIICPKAVIRTWVSQFKTHVPDEFNLIVPLKGTVKRKASDIENQLKAKRDSRPKVVILNYDIIFRPGLGHTYKQIGKRKKIITDKGLLRKEQWDMIIADELHRAKGAGSQTSMFMKMLVQNSKRRVGLTGTPLYNNPTDIYAQYRFLDPDIFGSSFQRFKMRYCIMGGWENRQIIDFINQDELNKKMFSIASRVKTEDVLKLPDFKDIYIDCQLSKEGEKIYKEFLKETILEFQNGEELTAANAMVKNLRLAQIASGIVTDDASNEHMVDTSKLEMLKELISNIDEPIVVFTRFRVEVREVRKMVEAMVAAGEKKGVCQIASGIDERDKFESGEADVIIVNEQAGGTGLNELVRARYAFYYSIGYSLGNHEQSRARIRRPGSDLTKDVLYYYLIAENTIDEVIKKALENKKNTIEAVVEYFARKAGIKPARKAA